MLACGWQRREFAGSGRIVLGGGRLSGLTLFCLLFRLVLSVRAILATVLKLANRLQGQKRAHCVQQKVFDILHDSGV